MLSLPALLLLAAVVASLWTAWRSWALPPFPGRFNFVAMQLSASWWATAAAMEAILPAPADKLFWAEMAWFGIVCTPSFWALFLWSYTREELSARWRLVPVAVGTLTWVAALTNDAHRLIYTAVRPISDEPGAALHYSHGLLFFVVTIYLYAFMVMSIVVTASGIHRATSAYRTHYLGFLVAMAVPWVANVGYVTGNLTFFDLEPTPFSFLLMGAVFYWLITRRRLFVLLPVARDALLDAVPDPVLVLDSDGTVVEANPAALALVRDGTPLGRRLAELPGLLALDGLEDTLPVPLTLENGGCPDGGPRSFEATRVPLTSGNVAARRGARKVGCLLMLRDVTHRRQAELRLEDTVRRLDLARLEAEERLAAEQEAKRALNGFLSMAAHEFKTPLAIIDGAAQLLLMDAEVKAPGMLPRLEKIRRAVRRQINILETCLADDRLNNPDFALRHDRLALPALLRAAASAQSDAAPGRRIELDLDACPPWLTGDGPMLELCVHNLLNNALKYSSPGTPVRLRGREETGADGPWLALSITDQGIGIPDGEREQVFDRFFRASNTGTAAGSGVGLNMVRRIAALHGGTVTVDSRLGEGSVFTLRIPLCEETLCEDGMAGMPAE
ncbi:histidine kinase [Azospirillum sp. TSH100]|uniref:sensor histidine kinase n=1 Tax=Azospirillum sp. TSH100 TaxID=652764 RepID=UPI000D604E62|nr:histidine kinase N-terminal 7TM domain-containing protein [Azospirillum sp. TSH100]PWC80305.1 histidine kinase [Azospirillum sp. TSH100]QCG91947.1 PAS domain-containing protein [Azospirillum sp. TSH100]